MKQGELLLKLENAKSIPIQFTPKKSMDALRMSKLLAKQKRQMSEVAVLRTQLGQTQAKLKQASEVVAAPAGCSVGITTTGGAGWTRVFASSSSRHTSGFD